MEYIRSIDANKIPKRKEAVFTRKQVAEINQSFLKILQEQKKKMFSLSFQAPMRHRNNVLLGVIYESDELRTINMLEQYNNFQGNNDVLSKNTKKLSALRRKKQRNSTNTLNTDKNNDRPQPQII